MKKILITGANGFTGRRMLMRYANCDAYQLIGCSLRPDLYPSDGYQFMQLDITDKNAVRAAIDIVRPDVIINCAALSVPDYCEQHHDEAYLLNVKAVEHLAESCETFQSRLIQLSTDFVFDGKTNRLYTESDQPAPVNYYGESKFLGEQAAAFHCANATVVRVVVVYGQPLAGQHGNIIGLVKQRLSLGQPVRVVSDQFRTPTRVDDVADGVKLLIDNPLNGLFHIAGAEYLSIAEMAFRTADYFGLDKQLIQPVTTAEMQESTPRPQYSGLSIEKAVNELGYAPNTFESGLVMYK